MGPATVHRTGTRLELRMADSLPVRCPACHRVHAVAPAAFPCPCGRPVTVPVLPGGAPIQVIQRGWKNSWVSVRCAACGDAHEWPHPQVGCECGVVLRLPVDTAAPPPHRPVGRVPPTAGQPVRRPAFAPSAIRTGQDAVRAAGRYLRWLGYADAAPTGDRDATGADLRADGLLARVDSSTRPTGMREVETLWLACLLQETAGACFSLAGYPRPAREQADRLAVPLFVMDLTGTPCPVNDAAHALIRTPPPGD